MVPLENHGDDAQSHSRKNFVVQSWWSPAVKVIPEAIILPYPVFSENQEFTQHATPNSFGAAVQINVTKVYSLPPGLCDGKHSRRNRRCFLVECSCHEHWAQFEAGVESAIAWG